MIKRLIDEWSERACGLTIDIVGDSKLSAEIQWIIAAPLRSRDPDEMLIAFETLRHGLRILGLQIVDTEHYDPAAELPNGTALESCCPYRPETCVGDHLVATGHGLARDLTNGLVTASVDRPHSRKLRRNKRFDTDERPIWDRS